MTKIKLLLGFLLLLLPMPAAALTTCFKPSTNTTWCTDNEKLAQEYSAYVYSLKENNTSFYEHYTRDSDYVQKEAVYPLVFKDVFFIDKLFKKYWWLKYAKNETELHKMLRVLYEFTTEKIPQRQIVDRDFLFRTQTILDYGYGVCLQRAEVAVAILRAFGIPTKMVNYLAEGAIEGRIRYDAQAIYWNGSEWKQILKDWEGNPITFEWSSV